MNVLEDWAIYDTIQIRKDANEKEGFISYVALGSKDEIPMFDQRKVDIGLAYTNRDSNESLEFAFWLKQIGLRFLAPPLHTAVAGAVPPIGEDNPSINPLFDFMQEHTGLILKIREDDKLRTTIRLLPAGTGPFGTYHVPSRAIPPVVNTLTNGEPFTNNRWTFSGDGLPMPRGCTFSVRLRISEYGKRLLKAWPGPTSYNFSLDGLNPIEVPACGLIRCDLVGWREVQQRGELHQ